MGIDVKQKITEVLIDKIGIQKTAITEEANFTKDLGMDSLDYAEIVMEFEEIFDIKIPTNDAEDLATVGKAVSYIRKRLSKNI